MKATITTLEAAKAYLVLGRLSGVVEAPTGWKALCPAHDDHSPSLSIKEGYRGVLLRCWAGCSIAEICQAVGLRESELFFDAPAARSYQKNGTCYEKANLNFRWDWRKQTGELLAITETRAILAEDFLENLKSIDAEILTDGQRDFLLEKICTAMVWIRIAEAAGELAYTITQNMRRGGQGHE